MKESYVIDHQKLKKFLITLLILFVLLFLAFKSTYYLAPFIIAFALSSLMEPLIRFLMGKIKLSRSIASVISLILMLILIGFVATTLVGKIISEVKGIAYSYPQLIHEFYRNIVDLSTRGNDFYISLPEEVTQHIGGLMENTIKTVTNLVNPLLKGVAFTAASIPGAFIFLLITILSTFFMASGRKDISNALNSKIPQNWYDKIIMIRDDVFSSLFKLIKAYMIIMSITFTELLIGFSILQLKYALVLAFITCIIDILPVLGSGTVLIPWAAYSLITGNSKLAIGLGLLYVIILIVRQILEPKIIGDQIGVHPLITLIAIYIGLKVFGAIGLMLGPILMLVLKNIFSTVYKDKTILDLLFKKV
jgi:sporulation integral membrane protein YtvI